MAEIEATRKKRKVLFAQPETPGERYTHLKRSCAFDPFIRFAAFVSFIVSTPVVFFSSVVVVLEYLCVT